MRVLIVDRIGAHSIWSLMTAIARDLVAASHRVTFCRFDDGNGGDVPPLPPGVEVADIKVPRKRRLWDLHAQYRVFAPAFRSALGEVRPDLVHTNFCVPGVAARAIACRQGIGAVVSTQHELYQSMYPHYRLGVRLTERHADAVVYVSATVARSFGRQAAVYGPGAARGERPRHLVIHNGVDCEWLEAIRRGAGARERGRIVCAGRLVPAKGQALLIEALPAILRSDPGAHVILIGSGPDEARLRNLAARLGLSERVRFMGWLPHEAVIAAFATAGAVVVPSDGTQEGFGLVVAEAIVAGARVVASRIPVFEEIAGTAAPAIRFFRAGERDHLAQAVTDALGASYAAADARSAAERIRTLFSIGRMVEAYRALYDDLVDDRDSSIRGGA